MLIESKIRRQAGTRVDFGTASYHFLPDDSGRHVANIEDEDHLSRLLAITEGFRVASSASLAAAPITPAPPEPQEPAPVQAIPPVQESAVPVVSDVDDDEPQDDGEHGGAQDQTGDEGAENADEVLDEETAKQARRDELAAEYKALFGRKPAYNKSIESMARDIAERQAANSKAAG